MHRSAHRLNIALALSFSAAALFGLLAKSARADSAVELRGTPVPVSGLDSGVTTVA